MDSGISGYPRLIAEVAQLVETAPSFGEFHAEFFQRVLRATGALGGAVWQRTADGSLAPGYQVEFDKLGLEPGSSDWAAHQRILDVAAQRERALWVPPQHLATASKKNLPPNNTPYALLLTSIQVDKQVVGVLELFLEPEQGLAERRNLARFLTELSGFAAAYFYKNNWREMSSQKQLWGQLETFVRKIHASLDVAEVSFVVAAEGRRLLECDQVSVGLRLGRKAHVQAISGAPAIDRRSRLVAAMGRLFEAVLSWGDKLVYKGERDERLPPGVLAALDEYLKESNSRLLVVVPLKDKDRPAQAASARAAWMAECFESTFSAAALESRMEVVSAHAGAALRNAVLHQRLPLRKLTGLLAHVQEGLSGHGAIKAWLGAAVIVAVVAVFTFVPASLRLEARGQLVPKNRQILFSPLTGKIVEVKAQNGDVVEKGQELLFIEDLETQLKVDQLGLKIHLAEKRLALLQEQLGKNLGAEERNNLTRERIQQDYELRRALVERDILLQESRSPRKSPVLAPIAGKVVTFDTQESLLGKAVKPGDALLRLARVQGSWEIDLDIPEANIASIRDGLKKSATATLDVDFLLASQPQRTYKGTLKATGLGGETTVKDSRVVLPARVTIADAELAAQLEKMPVGVEVRARVNCGAHALGYVWFHDLWEFVYERLLF